MPVVVTVSPLWREVRGTLDLADLDRGSRRPFDRERDRGGPLRSSASAMSTARLFAPRVVAAATGVPKEKTCCPRPVAVRAVVEEGLGGRAADLAQVAGDGDPGARRVRARRDRNGQERARPAGTEAGVAAPTPVGSRRGAADECRGRRLRGAGGVSAPKSVGVVVGLRAAASGSDGDVVALRSERRPPRRSSRSRSRRGRRCARACRPGCVERRCSPAMSFRSRARPCPLRPPSRSASHRRCRSPVAPHRWRLKTRG